MTISCIEPLGISTEQFAVIKEHYAHLGHDFRFYTDRKETSDELLLRMQDAEVVVVSNIPLRADLLEKCSRLRYLSVAFTGLDHIDMDFCHLHGIEVQNASGYSTTAVSELALGMMLDLLRSTTIMDAAARKGQGRGNLLGGELRGRTVGIIGTGAIGLATANLCMAFGAKVIAFSRTQKSLAEGISYVPLDTLLRESDIVSLHVPLTAETRGLIASEQLQLMKPGALLINTARGPVCDIDAVAASLHSGHLGGAAFDVFETEPPLPAGHPLIAAPRCLLTPHIAFATEESFRARAQIVFDHVDQWLGRSEQ